MCPQFLCVLVYTLTLLIRPTDPCSPGRGYGRRRTGQRSSPLVLRQHVPNTAESALAASGPAEGRIERDTDGFRCLVVNDNPDVVFKNDERNGDDLRMSVRCRAAVNELSLLVINRWPGLRLRVTEAWHDSPAPNRGASGDSLHLEGRAVDVTTSDRDRRKLGLLARLAVDAGFDWVYFATRSHVHCSVRSDSTTVAPSGGCFPGSSRVRIPDGRVLPLSQVAVGDRVLAFDDSTGTIRHDDVIAFLHRTETGTGNTTFIRISVVGGATVTLTRDHLIYGSTAASVNDVSPRFAGKVVHGDYVYCADGDSVAMCEVAGVDIVYFDDGLYAPLTSSGNIIIDDVITSCYAEVTSHGLAHLAMAPIRVAYSFARYFGLQRTATSIESLHSGSGIHPYASLLRTVADYFLPGVYDIEL